jgi:hypothetical protein
MARRSSQELTFPFRFTPAYRAVGAVFGVTPRRAEVSLAGGWLRVRFGPWSVATPMTNVAGVEVTGPYSLVKTAGPAHLSLNDRGLTFATNPERGLCIRFAEPVPGLEPSGRLRHPALTVTVEDVDGLRKAIEEQAATRPSG